MKKILLFILLIPLISQAQIVQKRLGLDPIDGSGFIFYDTVITLPRTTLKYFTGYGTFGSFYDTARAAISLTTTGSGAATYSSATGILNVPTPAASPAGWALAGNSITAATDFFGTTNNTSVRFYTNNILRAWLDSSNGRFGLGTTAPTSKLHIVTNSLGVTPSDASGIFLQNTTAAISGTQQISPHIVLGGLGFGTGANTSQDVRFRLYTLPVQNATNPLGQLLVQSSINSGAYVTAGTFDLTSVGTGQFTTGILNSTTAAGNGLLNTFASPLLLSSSTTGKYVSFSNTAVIGVEGNSLRNFQIRLDSTGSNPSSMTTGKAVFVITNGTTSGLGDVLINTLTQDNSAILNVVNTGKGVLLPRMTQLQRDSINLTVTSITVTNGGTGYSSTPTLTFQTFLGSITAVANNPTRVGNVITAVTVASAGSYNTIPTLTVTGGGGSGAVLTPVMTQVLPAGLEIYCTNCTATDASTGVKQVWNGSAWKNCW